MKWTVKGEGDHCPLCKARAKPETYRNAAGEERPLLVVLHSPKCPVFWDRRYDRRQLGKVAHRAKANPEISKRLFSAFGGTIQ